MPSIRRMILGHVVSDLYNKMTCRKKLNSGTLETTPMKKKGLSTYDITLHGVGHMIGAGIYMLTGIVAHDMAGPSAIFSFLIAGIVSIMAALCYAEINTRMLIKDSRNIYAHFSLGEFCAFFIGWNIILQHVFGAASVVKAWSIYVDSLVGGAISNYTRDVVGTYRVAEMEISPDLLAGGLCLLCTMFMILGLKSSAAVNSLLTMINFAMIGLIVILGIFYADLSNWNNENNGGFFPYGFNGVIIGAATCFYGFIGFDSISIASEKARNPQRSTLLAIIFSISIITIGYMLVSGVLTLIVPHREINPITALPEAFLANGIPWAKYIISIGALCGMTTTLFGSLFSLPNILYTMTIDGQLFAIFGHIRRTQVPIYNFIISGLVSALVAVLFDLQYLIEFTSFGILIKYIVISMSIILLRYVPEDSEDDTSSNLLLPPTEKDDTNSCCGIDIILNTKMPRKSKTQRFKSYFTWLEVVLENYDTGNIVRICGYIFMMFIIMMSVFLFTTFKFEGTLTNTDSLFLIYYLPLPLGSIAIIAALKQQPPTRKFQVPLVPLIPALSTFFSINLLLSLGTIIWLRFAIWMIAGIITYLLFGIHIWYYSKQITNTPKYFSTSTQQATSHSILMTSETEKSKKQGSSMSRVREKSDKVPILNDNKLVH